MQGYRWERHTRGKDEGDYDAVEIAERFEGDDVDTGAIMVSVERLDGFAAWVAGIAAEVKEGPSDE